MRLNEVKKIFMKMKMLNENILFSMPLKICKIKLTCSSKLQTRESTFMKRNVKKLKNKLNLLKEKMKL